MVVVFWLVFLSFFFFLVFPIWIFGWWWLSSEWLVVVCWLVAVFPSNVQFLWGGRGCGGGLCTSFSLLKVCTHCTGLCTIFLLKVYAHCIGLCTNFFFFLAEGLCTSWVWISMKKKLFYSEIEKWFSLIFMLTINHSKMKIFYTSKQTEWYTHNFSY